MTKNITLALLNGSKLEVLPSSEVGKLIMATVKKAGQVSGEIHSLAVQCAAHIFAHGDTGLAFRLCDELSNQSGFNVKGLRKWFGDACPMTARGNVWKLFETDSDEYQLYVKRMLKQTAIEQPVIGEDNKPVLNEDGTPKMELIGQPDADFGPGNRMFFIGWAEQHPFWTDDVVKGDQATNLRTFSANSVVGRFKGIKDQYIKALGDGLVPPESKPLIDKLVTDIMGKIAEFEQSNAADLYGEKQKIADFKPGITPGASAGQQADTPVSNETGNTVPAGEPTDTVEQQPGAEVGGDVTQGETDDGGVTQGATEDQVEQEVEQKVTA